MICTDAMIPCHEPPSTGSSPHVNCSKETIALSHVGTWLEWTGIDFTKIAKFLTAESAYKKIDEERKLLLATIPADWKPAD